MRPKLFLHIGHSKCASTTLQEFARQNLAALQAQGLLVADAQLRFPERGPLEGFPVQFFETQLQAGPAGRERVAAALTVLHERLAKGSHRAALISAENLCNPGGEALFRGEHERFDLQLVYYLRRQDDWQVSAWKQWHLREGICLEDFCRRATRQRYPGFAAVLERWRPVPAGRHVRPLHPSALHGGAVIPDFAAVLGIDIAGMRPVADQNQSPDGAVLEVLWRNPGLFASLHDHSMLDVLDRLLPRHDRQPVFLAADTRRAVLAAFAEENRALHREHFPHADFSAIFEPQIPERTAPTATDSAFRALGLLASAVVALQKQVDELRTARQPPGAR